MREAVNYILDYIYPPRCLICSDLILTNNGFCAPCWSKLNFITQPYCEICCFEFSLDYSIGNNKCIRCIDNPPNYDYARSLLRFDENSKKIIHTLKYYDRTFVANHCARMMMSRFKEDILSADIIMPVPMNKWKRLSRLYNHSQILAEEIAKLSAKEITSDVLIKSKNTRSQTGLARKYRLDNLSGSLSINYPQKIRRKRILLIDDVMTTGSTVNLCAGQLKKAGAKSVIVLCIARTLL